MVVFTVKLLHDISGLADYTFPYYKFKKVGAWDENTNCRSIFRGIGYPEDWLDYMIGNNFEKEVSAGACFSKR